MALSNGCCCLLWVEPVGVQVADSHLPRTPPRPSSGNAVRSTSAHGMVRLHPCLAMALLLARGFSLGPPRAAAPTPTPTGFIVRQGSRSRANMTKGQDTLPCPQNPLWMALPCGLTPLQSPIPRTFPSSSNWLFWFGSVPIHCMMSQHVGSIGCTLLGVVAVSCQVLECASAGHQPVRLVAVVL